MRAVRRPKTCSPVLFNAGPVGAQRQTKYLRSGPMMDVSNSGADILYPVPLRDAEALGL